jgi:glutamate/tyrosine decarboxylase-like PLP-dependent enzyme
VLVRDRNAHYRSFTLTPDYLKRAERGLAAGLWPSDYDIQLSRGFKALKIWMAIKEHGVERFGRLIEQNVEQARYLAGRVDATPELQRLAPVPLNVVCFRYFVPDMEDAVLDALNQELLVQLQEHGIATLGITRVNGVQALRVCVVNHRSRREDFDLLVREVTRLGAALAAEGVR